MTIFLSMLVGWLFLNTGCDSTDNGGEMIWDYANRQFTFEVTTADGQQLIDPHTGQGYEWLNKIYVEYNGNMYANEGRPIREEQELRAMIEQYKGLNVVKKQGRYVLMFGEFQPRYGKKQMFKLHLPDGQTDVVEFTHTANNGKFSTHIWLNGKKQHGFDLKLVAKPYLEPGEKVTSAPVHIYLRLVDLKGTVLPDDLVNTTILTYKGNNYTLTEKGEHLMLLSGISSFMPWFSPDTGHLYLYFGPFYPEENIKDGSFVLTLYGKEIPVHFQCYKNEAGEVVYKAGSGIEKKPAKSFYFRNGPLINVKTKS
ncbi:hypothetical protein HR11_02940 [Porphyromonas macacae]|uniref:hypothetical protein n=1 Tax=Porphyromonas macacae TaxID=28115 RepID=UPI00052C5A76|nr:hypothetical protein [Porphyromonas macacae]KGN99255.1 hypothetical protein HR11_02940 [Porphyromonas macacae]